MGSGTRIERRLCVDHFDRGRTPRERYRIPKFAGGANDYHLLPGDLDYSELAMSHLSVNVDRSGYQQDPNVVLPLELLRQLAGCSI